MTGWRTRARLAKTTGALQLISGWLTPCRQIIKYRFHFPLHTTSSKLQSNPVVGLILIMLDAAAGTHAGTYFALNIAQHFRGG